MTIPIGSGKDGADVFLADYQMGLQDSKTKRSRRNEIPPSITYEGYDTRTGLILTKELGAETSFYSKQIFNTAVAPGELLNPRPGTNGGLPRADSLSMRRQPDRLLTTRRRFVQPTDIRRFVQPTDISYGLFVLLSVEPRSIGPFLGTDEFVVRTPFNVSYSFINYIPKREFSFTNFSINSDFNGSTDELTLQFNGNRFFNGFDENPRTAQFSSQISDEFVDLYSISGEITVEFFPNSLLTSSDPIAKFTYNNVSLNIIAKPEFQLKILSISTRAIIEAAQIPTTIIANYSRLISDPNTGILIPEDLRIETSYFPDGFSNNETSTGDVDTVQTSYGERSVRPEGQVDYTYIFNGQTEFSASGIFPSAEIFFDRDFLGRDRFA